jgi:hypothetical protein
MSEHPLPSSESDSSSFMLRVLLAFGGFLSGLLRSKHPVAGVVISLLELLQGDTLLTIILPLLFSLISIILLFLSRVSKQIGTAQNPHCHPL